MPLVADRSMVALKGPCMERLTPKVQPPCHMAGRICTTNSLTEMDMVAQQVTAPLASVDLLPTPRIPKTPTSLNNSTPDTPAIMANSNINNSNITTLVLDST